MDVTKIVGNISMIGLAFTVVRGARAASDYPMLALNNRFTKEKIPVFWKHVVVLVVMRWAVSAALVDSLPESDIESPVETMTFRVVLSYLILSCNPICCIDVIREKTL
jgi:hypothetical protein